MQFNMLTVSVENNIAIVKLNRPEVFNALCLELLEELEKCFIALEKDDSVRVVIIAGDERFFCAGADVSQMVTVTAPSQIRPFIALIQRVFNSIEAFTRPVIAAVGGLALGGGTELALSCDLRIAADNALFSQPEIYLGVIPGAGGTQRLPRVVGLTRAKELLYTGGRVSAKEALEIGLVNKVVPPEKLLDEAKALAEKIAKRPPLAVMLTKACVNHGMEMPLAQGIAYEGRCFEWLFSTKDQREGMTAFLEKRKPQFKGE